MLNVLSSARTRAPRIVRAAIAAAALANAVACGSDPAGPAKPTLAFGTYEMQVMGELPVPAVIQDGPYEWEGTNYERLLVRVDGGFIELEEDHTFRLSVDIYMESELWTEEGTFERSGNYRVVDDRIELDIRQPKADVWSGRWNGDRLGFDVSFLGEVEDPWFMGFELRRN